MAPWVSDAAFLSASRESVIRDLGLQPLDLTQALDRRIRSAEDSLDAIAGFPTEVWVSARGSTAAHPAVGTIVSRSQLESIRTNSNVRDFPVIVRFILAHEKTHAAQFRTYGAAIMTRPLQERSVYEAQADIIAGKDLTETLGLGTPGAGNVGIEDALRVAFDLGTEQYALANHPSHEARRTAARLGMAAGMITNFQRMGGPLAAGSIQTLVAKLDVQPGETTLPWSLRAAQRVTNFKRPAIADLVQTTDSVRWNTNGQPPIVAYGLTYENIGRRALLIDMEVRCVSLDRQDRENTMRWQLISAKSYRFRLAPGEHRKIADILQWDTMGGLIPRLVLPTDPTALVSVRYDPDVGEASDAIEANREAQFAALRIAGAPEEHTMPLAITGLVDAALSDFTELRAGPGKRLDASITYASSLTLPGALRTTLWIPVSKDSGDAAYARTVVVRTASLAVADSAFEALLRAFVATEPGFSRSDAAATPASRRTSFTTTGMPEVTAARRFTSGVYEVTFTVTAPATH